MPRVAIGVQQLSSTGYPADGTELVWTAADAVNFQEIPLTDRTMLLARNVGATPRTVTISSAPVAGRLGDITADSIPAASGADAKVHVYGPFASKGWRQTGGKLFFQAAHADVQFAVVRW